MRLRYTVLGGIGMVGLGLVSKAFNVHSTIEQVQAVSALPSAEPKP